MKKLEKLGVSVLKENGILIDWLSVTFHDISVQDLKRIIGLDAADIDWDDQLAFRHGYPRQCTFMGIIIRHGADKIENYADDGMKSASDKVRFDMGIALDLSGSACRAWETYSHGDWIKLLTDICRLQTRINITRLDLAFDDHTGVLDINRIALDAKERNFTGPAKKCRIVWSDDQEKDIQGTTVYVGSEKSPVYLRIYDKAAERGFKDRHWIRVELQLRRDRAAAAIAEILKWHDVGHVFTGVLRNYCCFREPVQDTNKSRWPIASYWDQLLNGAERIRLLISPGEPYNFRKTEDCLVHQWGQALITYERIHGNVHDLIKRCYQAHPDRKKKYKLAEEEAIRESKQLQAKLKQLRAGLGLTYNDFEEIPGQIDWVDLINDGS